MVERNSRAEVMKNMSLNDIMEEKLANETKVSVNSSHGTSSKSPVRRIVMRELGISVLQVGDVNQPVIDPQPGHTPHQSNGGEAVFLGEVVEGRKSGQDSNVRQDDVVVVLLVKNRRGRNKMVHNPLGSARISLASDVGQQISVPTKKLLNKQVVEGHDGGVLSRMLETSQRHELLTLSGDKHHISSEMTSGLVVLGMGDLPGEIRDHKSRVENPTNNVIDRLVAGESTMATFVSKNPAASTNQTLKNTVNNPQSDSSRKGRNQVDIGNSTVTEKKDQKKISSNIGKRETKGSIVTALGNGVQNSLDSDIRNLKLVSVGIDRVLNIAGELSSLVLVEAGLSLSQSGRHGRIA